MLLCIRFATKESEKPELELKLEPKIQDQKPQANSFWLASEKKIHKLAAKIRLNELELTA